MAAWCRYASLSACSARTRICYDSVSGFEERDRCRYLRLGVQHGEGLAHRREEVGQLAEVGGDGQLEGAVLLLHRRGELHERPDLLRAQQTLLLQPPQRLLRLVQRNAEQLLTLSGLI